MLLRYKLLPIYIFLQREGVDKKGGREERGEGGRGREKIATLDARLVSWCGLWLRRQEVGGKI